MIDSEWDGAISPLVSEFEKPPAHMGKCAKNKELLRSIQFEGIAAAEADLHTIGIPLKSILQYFPVLLGADGIVVAVNAEINNTVFPFVHNYLNINISPIIINRGLSVDESNIETQSETCERGPENLYFPFTHQFGRIFFFAPKTPLYGMGGGKCHLSDIVKGVKLNLPPNIVILLRAEWAGRLFL